MSPSRTAAFLVLLLVTLLGASLAWALLTLPAPTVDLPAQVAERLGDSGTAHPVTAVLLNFRGYDTLLEIGVLLLAVLGVLTLGLTAAETGGRRAAPRDPVLSALVRTVAPIMVLAAGHLLWAGAHQPGGAFQAGALLAGAGVMLRLSGLIPGWARPHWLLRAGLGLGFLAFLGVAAATSLLGLGLLEYPRALASLLILLIETGLTLSIALILLSLFVGAPVPEGSSPGGKDP